MKQLFFSITLLLPTFAAAQVLGPDQLDKQPMFNKTFERLHSSAKINCGYYDYWSGSEGKVEKVQPISQEYSLSDKSVSSEYQVGEANLKVQITAGGQNGLVSYEINGIEIPAFLSKFNMIWFNNSNLSNEQNTLINKLKLRELSCSLDMAKEETFVINDKDLHVAMHPYVTYDVDGESDPVIEEYVNNSELPQLLLLDDTRDARKAATLNVNEFMSLGRIPHKTKIRFLTTPNIQIPKDIPTRVAGAGHIKFKLTRPEHEVTYTGGNYNFCILNSNRRLLHALFDSPATKTVKINYITEGTVVQKFTFVKGLSFTRAKGKIRKKNYKYYRGSNLLANVFRAMKKDEGALDTYLNAHFDDFKTGILSMRSQHYGTVKVIRQGMGTKRVETLTGSGEGDYTIIFNYVE